MTTNNTKELEARNEIFKCCPSILSLSCCVFILFRCFVIAISKRRKKKAKETTSETVIHVAHSECILNENSDYEIQSQWNPSYGNNTLTLGSASYESISGL